MIRRFRFLIGLIAIALLSGGVGFLIALDLIGRQEGFEFGDILLIVGLLGLVGGAIGGVVLWLRKPYKDLQEKLNSDDENLTHYIISNEIPEDVLGLAWTIQAVIENKSAVIAEMATEQNKLEQILRQMRDGVMIVDEFGRVILINSTAERLFEVEEQEVIGRSFAQVVRQHQFIERWQRYVDTGKEQFVSVEILHRKFFWQMIVNPFKSRMKGHALVLFQDFGDIRQLESVRQDFISNISHELRTPLTSLKALAETLQDGALEDPSTAEKFLNRIDVEVDSLTQLVAELLELSRIESGKVPLKLKATSVERAIERPIDRLRAQAERAGVQLKVEIEHNLPKINIDQERIEQVLVNLIHNAIKFTASGGEVRIGAEKNKNQVCLTIQDTGAGIPAESLSRIFERFYKTDPARSSGGTGLGLSIARHLVEAHGGRIWAESIEGQGSTFFVCLPIVG